MSGCPTIVWAIDADLPPYEKLTLIYLTRRANSARVCWPSLATIAADLRISPRSIHTAVHALEAKRYIRIEKKFRQPLHYHILAPKETQTPPPVTPIDWGFDDAPTGMQEVQAKDAQPANLQDAQIAEPASLTPKLAPQPAESSPIPLAAAANKVLQASKEGTVGLRPTAAAASPPTALPDVRKELFNEGLAIARGLSGRSTEACRGMIGKWLRLACDDASRVLETLRYAQDLRPADPNAFMFGALRQRDPTTMQGEIGMLARFIREAQERGDAIPERTLLIAGGA